MLAGRRNGLVSSVVGGGNCLNQDLQDLMGSIEVYQLSSESKRIRVRTMTLERPGHGLTIYRRAGGWLAMSGLLAGVVRWRRGC